MQISTHLWGFDKRNGVRRTNCTTAAGLGALKRSLSRGRGEREVRERALEFGSTFIPALHLVLDWSLSFSHHFALLVDMGNQAASIHGTFF